jgi:hypothetical protein
MKREQKITLGEKRANNRRTRLIVYCSDFKCSHSVVVDAASWGDEVRLSDLEPSSPARRAAGGVPMSGRSLRPAWGPADNASFTKSGAGGPSTSSPASS